MSHRVAIVALFALSPFLPSATSAGDGAPTSVEVESAMRKAAEFYRRHVARHGGYVYYYSLDLTRRLGEGVATEDQIWVQPPGTPTVGMAYLKALTATGDQFYLKSATETAEALIHGQLESGGWTNCIDFDPRGARVARYRNGAGRGRNFSSLDDDQTQSAIRFLMRADGAHGFKHEKIHESVTIALDRLLAAQFANGAFPQGWDGPVETDRPTLRASYPQYDWRTEGRIKEYWDMYTLNDGLAGSVSKVLVEAHRLYGQSRYKEALVRLGRFLQAAQLPQPQPAWSQQYNYRMQPIWARKFEPPAVAGRESQDALETLLRIRGYTGDDEFLEPVAAAIAYLRRSLLPDGQLARYYELRTNRPLYMRRRGSNYELTYDDSDLPDHYGWKTESRLDRIERRYRALSDDGKDPFDEDQGSRDDMAARVRSVLDSLDEQGRWITTFEGERLVGNPKFRPGERFISSAVFSENLELLSDYLTSRSP